MTPEIESAGCGTLLVSTQADEDAACVRPSLRERHLSSFEHGWLSRHPAESVEYDNRNYLTNAI